MKYLLLAVLLLLTGCGTFRPRTHTETPSLKYAKSYVEDAKDFNRRAIKSNDEIDVLVRKLLEGTE